MQHGRLQAAKTTLFIEKTSIDMFLISIFRKNKPFKLRKRYDRAREKADKMKDYRKKIQLLRMLDTVEANLILLEEDRITSKFERRRMAAQIEAAVENAWDIIKEKRQQG